MVQHEHSAAPVAGDGPTEESPLLGHTSDASVNQFGSAATLATNGHSRDQSGAAKSISEEEASLNASEQEEEAGKGRAKAARIISVLLIGIFVAHADGSMLLATHPAIASEFNDLGDSAWLITSFALAGAASQTMYGKLSDIYGRKLLVITAYLVLIVGCIIVGAGQTMWQVILGRVISGVGTSGMTALVSVLITDLLPLREVAQWRAYVNVVATTGRSVGGPLGGWLADVVGWRWSFLGQVPVIGVAILLGAIYLPPAPTHSEDDGVNGAGGASPPASKRSKFSRIDFKGSFLFAATILALLLPIELGGTKLPWSHPVVIGLFVASGALLFLFIVVENREEEPILPLEIFHRRDAVLSFLIMGLQTAAQISLMFSVPLYFQVTANTSNTESGLHLVPAVFGNAVGGLLSGLIIKRSGRYKFLIILAVVFSSASYLTLMLRWHGNTNWWESLYIFPGGFGTGIAQSALFISLQVVIDPAHMAPAISFMYLSTTVFMTIGLPISSAAMQSALRSSLEARLVRLGLDSVEVQQILFDAISDVGYVGRVTGAVHTAIVDSYVDGLWWSHGFSFLCSTTAFVTSIFLKQRRLDGPRA
ncbi:major facilitator superfamily domain-containing protein [Lasiosphaeria hispida]|uniref:Major facilitator superfamily domain-containing protein n=1 Tax=Lasiosphaeria hispida TaxID=260671 RepID=A0AAJ0HAS2_9PEZI|nr:major facilitator superfamily domain-containing protein [Lasiosphaeria hispida]